MSKKIYEVHVWDNGDVFWYLDGERHREDGPAIKYGEGTKLWYQHERLHREDGPAVERTDGTKAWYLNDKELTEEQYKAATSKKDDCSGKVVEIEGKKYKLQSLG